MYTKQAFQGEHNRHCGSMGRGKFGGPWGRGKFSGFRGKFGGWGSQPPVNIEETNEAYIISLFAAGLAKEQVTLRVKDDVLTVAYPGADAATGQDATPESSPQGNYTYQEHSQGAFDRSFRLNDKVLVESISASYADGILRVTLPKNPATNKPAQTITVA